MSPFRTDRVRLAILVKRKPGIDKEEFSRYWAEVHGPLFASLEIAKRSIMKYEQAHCNAAALQALRAAGMKVLEWDGMVIFEAETYEKIIEVLRSDDYHKIIIPDAQKFMDLGEAQFMPVDLVTLIDKV
ncbi:hypothetical protein C8F04DRAFT_1160761 [Mycena alexandri]|uniref:EthD domain-containing protein n=1 Tax=Mycena alexandri TaxID=1745969 RepID=A0AAD6WPW1_9AGAR|nr:hypothetical protein C8F04DRAFT_1160761 [Mycena alexandri]